MTTLESEPHTDPKKLLELPEIVKAYLYDNNRYSKKLLRMRF